MVTPPLPYILHGENHVWVYGTALWLNWNVCFLPAVQIAPEVTFALTEMVVSSVGPQLSQEREDKNLRGRQFKG